MRRVKRRKRELVQRRMWLRPAAVLGVGTSRILAILGEPEVASVVLGDVGDVNVFLQTLESLSLAQYPDLLLSVLVDQRLEEFVNHREEVGCIHNEDHMGPFGVVLVGI